MVGCFIVSFIELFGYSFGSLISYQDLPRAEAVNIFPDLGLWTYNGYGCDINPWELEGSNQCGNNPDFNYPWYPIAILRILGLGESYHRLSGLLLGIASLFATYLLIRAFSGRVWLSSWTCIVGGTLVVSKPFRYALERGQTDLLVYILLILSIFLAASHYKGSVKARRRGFYGANLALGAMTLIKLYPITALVYYNILAFRNHGGARASGDKWWANVGVALAYILLVGLLCIHPYQLTSAYNILNLGGHGFGLSVVVAKSAMHTEWDGVQIKLLIFCVALIVTMREIYRIEMKVRVKEIAHCHFTRIAIVLPSSMLVPLYIATENIYYKYILLIPLIFALSKEVACTRHRSELNWSYIVILLSSFFLLFSLYMPSSRDLAVYIESYRSFGLEPIIFGSLSGVLLTALAKPNRFLVPTADNQKLQG